MCFLAPFAACVMSVAVLKRSPGTCISRKMVPRPLRCWTHAVAVAADIVHARGATYFTAVSARSGGLSNSEIGCLPLYVCKLGVRRDKCVGAFWGTRPLSTDFPVASWTSFRLKTWDSCQRRAPAPKSFRSNFRRDSSLHPDALWRRRH